MEHNPELNAKAVAKGLRSVQAYPIDLSGMRFENLEDEEFVLPRTEFRPEHEESVLEHGDFRELVFVTGRGRQRIATSAGRRYRAG